METLGTDAEVHAVIALILRTGATGDLLAAIAEADLGVPLAVVVLNQPEAVRLVDVKGGKVPAYAYPEVAARALSRAVRYAEWRATPNRTVPVFPDVDAEQAREIVHAYLAKHPEGGWLPGPDAEALLRLYRIPLVAAAGGGAAGDVPGGTELMIGVTDDQMFGPLVVLGRGRLAAGPLADPAARLAPLTEADADDLTSSIGPAPGVDRTALRDALLRVSRLTDDLPEITELELNPVIAGADGAAAAYAQIRVAPQVPRDPFLRRLRLPAAGRAARVLGPPPSTLTTLFTCRPVT